MSGIVGLLLAASIIRLFLGWKNPNTDYTELHQRIKSWWIMIAILFAVLVINKATAISFFCFLSYLALKEFLSHCANATI